MEKKEKNAKRKPVETTKSFKDRIAALMRELEGRTEEDDLYIPRNRASDILVRKPGDKGYYPPPRKRKK